MLQGFPIPLLFFYLFVEVSKSNNDNKKLLTNNRFSKIRWKGNKNDIVEFISIGLG